jgi:hypothetical protein
LQSEPRLRCRAPRGHPAMTYPTTKGAIISFTKTMAGHHGKDGIRVNAIAPRMVYIPIVYADGMTEEAREHRKALTALGTEGMSWDVSEAVLYLAASAPNGSPALCSPRCCPRDPLLNSYSGSDLSDGHRHRRRRSCIIAWDDNFGISRQAAGL